MHPPSTIDKEFSGSQRCETMTRRTGLPGGRSYSFIRVAIESLTELPENLVKWPEICDRKFTTNKLTYGSNVNSNIVFKNFKISLFQTSECFKTFSLTRMLF